MPSFIYEERTARFNIYLSRIPRSAAIIPAGAGLLYTPPTRYLSLHLPGWDRARDDSRNINLASADKAYSD